MRVDLPAPFGPISQSGDVASAGQKVTSSSVKPESVQCLRRFVTRNAIGRSDSATAVSG